jgi:hypothetical protein
MSWGGGELDVAITLEPKNCISRQSFVDNILFRS